MSGNMPELGSKISLISKADIRYEGRLFTVDPNECTIALASGKLCAHSPPWTLPRTSILHIHSIYLFRPPRWRVYENDALISAKLACWAPHFHHGRFGGGLSSLRRHRRPVLQLRASGKLSKRDFVASFHFVSPHHQSVLLGWMGIAVSLTRTSIKRMMRLGKRRRMNKSERGKVPHERKESPNYLPIAVRLTFVCACVGVPHCGAL